MEDLEQEDGDNDPEQEELNADCDNTRRGRGGSTRLTRRPSCIKEMQVRVLPNPRSDRNISESDRDVSNSDCFHPKVRLL